MYTAMRWPSRIGALQSANVPPRDMDSTGMNTVKIKRWLALAGLLLATTLSAQLAAASEKVTYLITDAQGSVVAEMDAQGNVTYTAAYRPYGHQQVGAPQPSPGYTGHVNDPDTGLVYMQHRYYGPDTARFLSVDPVVPKPGNVFNFNRYAYVGNNPVNRIDPSGMFECKDRASCEAGTRLRKAFIKAQKHYKQGSPAYKTLAAGIKALGTANDGGLIHVVTVMSRVNALGWGGAPKGKTPTLTINLTKLNALPKTRQGEAEFAATGRHELKHVTDDMAAGDTPHDTPNEFWHEVRGIRSETPIWEAFGVNDPWGTWTTTNGLNMNAVYKEAQASTDAYCSNGTCP